VVKRGYLETFVPTVEQSDRKTLRIHGIAVVEKQELPVISVITAERNEVNKNG
jgi:hypothetical protein